MDKELLGYVIEFSIGLVGFSGVIAVFAGRSQNRIQLELFRLRNLLFGATIPAFLCFAALGIHDSISDEGLAWLLILSFSFVCLGAYAIHGLWARARMPTTQQNQLQNWVFILSVGLLSLNMLLQVLILLRFVSIDPFIAFYSGLVSLLLISIYQFIRAVLDGVESNSYVTNTDKNEHRDTRRESD